MQIQYDYLTAYLDFFNTKPTIARKIAQKYVNHPIPRWRDLFSGILDQLNEIENNIEDKIEDDNKKKKNQDKLIDFDIDNHRLKNLSSSSTIECDPR